jgi:hypothetical protein
MQMIIISSVIALAIVSIGQAQNSAQAQSTDRDWLCIADRGGKRIPREYAIEHDVYEVGRTEAIARQKALANCNEKFGRGCTISCSYCGAARPGRPGGDCGG